MPNLHQSIVGRPPSFAAHWEKKISFADDSAGVGAGSAAEGMGNSA